MPDISTADGASSFICMSLQIFVLAFPNGKSVLTSLVEIELEIDIMIKRAALVVPTLLMLALSCRQQSAGAIGVESPRSSRVLTAIEIARYLNQSEIWVAPSSTIPAMGDLRPLWIVTGRIKSTYNRDLSSVRIRVIAYEKNKETDAILDTAEFDVRDVPALEAKAFRREVHLLVSPGDFQFG